MTVPAVGPERSTDRARDRHLHQPQDPAGPAWAPPGQHPGRGCHTEARPGMDQPAQRAQTCAG